MPTVDCIDRASKATHRRLHRRANWRVKITELTEGQTEGTVATAPCVHDLLRWVQFG